jgi:hypothetical protein
LGKYNYFQQIYDDACDVGFLVRNPGTNRTILVSLFKTNVTVNEDDGDVVSWVFTPSSESVRLYPLLNNYKFVIYNDTMTNKNKSTSAATDAATEAATDAATRGATRAATSAATWAATEAATWHATEAATWEFVKD